MLTVLVIDRSQLDFRNEIWEEMRSVLSVFLKSGNNFTSTEKIRDLYIIGAVGSPSASWYWILMNVFEIKTRSTWMKGRQIAKSYHGYTSICRDRERDAVRWILRGSQLFAWRDSRDVSQVQNPARLQDNSRLCWMSFLVLDVVPCNVAKFVSNFTMSWKVIMILEYPKIWYCNTSKSEETWQLNFITDKCCSPTDEGRSCKYMFNMTDKR